MMNESMIDEWMIIDWLSVTKPVNVIVLMWWLIIYLWIILRRSWRKDKQSAVNVTVSV